MNYLGIKIRYLMEAYCLIKNYIVYEYLRLLEVKVVDRLMSSISHSNIMVDILILFINCGCG